MVLLQLLSANAVEEKQFVQILGGLKLVSTMSDSEFEILLNLYNRVCEKKVVYSKNASDICVGLLCQTQLKNVQNQKIQAWIAF
jgi:hypothetical protein